MKRLFAIAAVVAMYLAQATSAFAIEDNILEWDDVFGEETYHVEQAPVCGAPPSAWVEIGSTSADVTTFTDPNVPDGDTRCYRVFARNVGGDSGYSNEAGKTVRPGTPGGLRVKATAPASP